MIYDIHFFKLLSTDTEEKHTCWTMPGFDFTSVWLSKFSVYQGVGIRALAKTLDVYLSSFFQRFLPSLSANQSLFFLSFLFFASQK